MSTITLAISQYAIQALPHWQAYTEKMEALVKSAKLQGAQLLLLPEYAGLELASWAPSSLQLQFKQIQSLFDDYLALFTALAIKYQLYIQPGTVPVMEDGQKFYNRAFLFGMNGTYGFQDKMQLTKFERQSGFMQAGTALNIFETALGALAISICYDSEFPILIQQQVSAGANLVLVPSCTDNLHGHSRVELCCRARAIENQCFVAQASLVGNAAWCEFIDINVGKSGIFCPADHGFPSHGIIAQAQMNLPQLVLAKLSLKDLALVRQMGQVSNFNDTQQLCKTHVSTVQLR